MQCLAGYSWPGNIRELRNVIERIMLMGSGSKDPVSAAEVLEVLPKTSPYAKTEDPARFSLGEIERMHIQRVMDSSGGNKTQAAKTLQVDYKTLLTKLKKYGLVQ